MAKYEIIDGVGIIPEGTTIVEGDFLQSAFEDHESLKSVVFPDSVTEIGDFAFSGCTGLTSIVIPDSVTKIGSAAFWECTGLKSIVIGNSVTEIGNWVFDRCTGLKTINVPAKKADYYKKRLLEELHHLIVELPEEKNAKK